MSTVRVTLWNEFLHEVEAATVRAIYPDGIHQAIAEGIADKGDFQIETATLREPEHGLTQDLLDRTDVLAWWGHKAHDEVADEIVERVYRRVLEGMGIVVLHSGHMSKIFRKLLGTHGTLRWREADEKERLWNLQPSHPILAGIPDYVELEMEEMYGERFDVPPPDELLMISWFQGGEVFRSLCTWQRGHGRVVYFRPGHETYPTYRNEHVLQIIANALTYGRQTIRRDDSSAPQTAALEPVPNPGKDHIL